MLTCACLWHNQPAACHVWLAPLHDMSGMKSTVLLLPLFWPRSLILYFYLCPFCLFFSPNTPATLFWRAEWHVAIEPRKQPQLKPVKQRLSTILQNTGEYKKALPPPIQVSWVLAQQYCSCYSLLFSTQATLLMTKMRKETAPKHHTEHCTEHPENSCMLQPGNEAPPRFLQCSLWPSRNLQPDKILSPHSNDATSTP